MNDKDWIDTIYLKQLLNHDYNMNVWMKNYEDDAWDTDYQKDQMLKELTKTVSYKENRKVETNEDKVVRILKGDFEKKFGISFDAFTETYHKMLETCPERLI